MGEFLNGHPQQPIPISLQEHEAELLAFETRCRKTCHQILRLLALGLEVSHSRPVFLSFFENDYGSSHCHFFPIPNQAFSQNFPTDRDLMTPFCV